MATNTPRALVIAEAPPSPTSADHNASANAWESFKDQNHATYIEDKVLDNFWPDGNNNMTDSQDEEHLAPEDVLVSNYWMREVEHEAEEAEMETIQLVAPGVDISLVWETPAGIASHDDLQDMYFPTFEEFAPLVEPQAFAASDTGRKVIFTTRKLSMMNSPTARLNDVCINGIGSLLHD
ncbi:hypothetical protein C0991_011945 [Blastosporella zonata]|nr:hypothetical protein C0991_011945 [Blastosporella zonata]